MRACKRLIRRGSALYLTVAAVSTLVAGTGLVLIAAQRADRQLQENIEVEQQAYWCAQGGLQLAVACTEQITTWRSLANVGTAFTNMPVGPGTCTVQIYDPDGSLSDDDTDGLTLTATGAVRGALNRNPSTCRVRADLVARPHRALRHAAFSNGSDDLVFDGASIRGPVRANGKIKGTSSVTLADDSAFTTVAGYTIDSPLYPRSYTSTPAPAPPVQLAPYLAIATSITGACGATCTVRGYNLTPTDGMIWSTNANGIYALNAGGRDVVIENLHVRGTLIIHNVTGRNVTIQKGFWIEPGPLNYPVLMVDNPNGDLDIFPSQNTLSESSSTQIVCVNGTNYTRRTSVDFNESGFAWDNFGTSLRGIVWSSSKRIRLGGSVWWNYTGALIGMSRIEVRNVVLDDDPALQDLMLPGFVEPGLRLVAGSYREVP